MHSCVRGCLPANLATALTAKNGVGVGGDGVRVLHMCIPKGNIQSFIVRRPHIAVPQDLVLIPALKVPIGDRHTLGRLRDVDHFHRGAVRRIGNGFPVDRVRTVFCGLGLGLKRIVCRTNPNG